MPDYQKMYFQLAAKVADVVEILLKAQQEGEDTFMDGKPAIAKVSAIQEGEDDLIRAEKKG